MTGEWTSGRPASRPGTGRQRRWRRLAWRVSLALIFGLLLALAPAPPTTPRWLIAAQVPSGVFVVIALIGKALYDTFFWDRYYPH